MDYELLKNEPMSAHTTFKTGGIAERLYKIKSENGLLEVMDICKKEGSSPLIIGNGSNLLVSDKGISDPVIELSTGFDEISVSGNEIYAQSGALLSKVSKIALENELKGFEFASGIPGTIGGAVYMNAGAYGGEMKDVVKSVRILDNGEIKEIKGNDMDFGYRHSIAMEKEFIVLGVTLALEKGDKEEISSLMNDLNSRRRERQPLEYPSAGSTFKRPEGYFAGKLIMDSGLAGKSIGGAMVSPKHCGFIVNTGNATSTDVFNLIKYVQSEVKDIYGVDLETEVKLIGDFE
ncbi:MAG: UDP-N-acetylmuramate dehydrogenase [Eubacterium sp.]|nr:UDP-N-acetylmuramate dehydrogenase [Eubacterium sp.]